ncbi:MAG: glycosyltransferase family 39 protein [Bryobacterales bacterium]|nr:glycosyltransferase family 39 protein [Bryobacteraceae bacterium]MDW8355897.1 glycosyltransferase family 39 protein [Bryobacterales bacterium]
MREQVLTYAALTAGFASWLGAAVVSPAVVERWILGEATGALGWGPLLLRVTLFVNGCWLLTGAWWLRTGRFTLTGRVLKSTLSRRDWIALGILTAVALVLRVYQLDSTLWLDEIGTLRDFVRRPFREILTLFPHGNQHMLYSLLGRISTLALGESPAALRLPAVAFGVASLWPLFFLGRRLLGTKYALFSCALLAVSYHHVWFSQNARAYTALLFFVVAATYFWVHALETAQFRQWLAYAVATTGGFAAHISMAFLTAAHVSFWLLAGVRQRRLEWRALAAWSLAATWTLQFYSLSLPQFVREGMHEPSPRSEWSDLTWVIAETLANLTRAFTGSLSVALAAVALAYGLWRIWRREPAAGFSMLVPIFLVAFTFAVRQQNLFPRYFFFAMGFAILCVVSGAVEIPRRLLPGGSAAAHERAAVLLLTAMVVLAAVMVPRCYEAPKQDFTGARDYVEARRRPGEVALTVGLANIALPGYYAPAWHGVETAEELYFWIQSGQGLWLVYTLPTQLRGFHPEMWRLVENHFLVERSFGGTLRGGEVYVCRLRSGARSETSVGEPLETGFSNTD